MQSNKVNSIRGRSGMKRGHNGDDLWSRRGGVSPMCSPRSRISKNLTHRYERHREKQQHIKFELRLEIT